MEQNVTLEVNTRTIELGVNLTTNNMASMGLTPVEAVLVAGHVLGYLEQKFDIKFSDITSNFKPDKKLDLVPPPN
jgi:hypothetical protein